MGKWLKSVYSDGTAAFVSNPASALFETVNISIWMYEDAPVKCILLRLIPNGVERLDEMHMIRKEHGLVYYKVPLKMTDYVQPAWVKEAVFYQIFPERFCNGDESNDVKSGEYSHEGFQTIRMLDWDAKPLTYQEGHCLDFYGGDLQGVKEKIPYLKELGVTAGYLNFIFVAPSVHKYDCLDYFHVDSHFGGDEALAALSAVLHENGMKLILDISINHTGITHKWFNWDGVESLPTLNYTSESLRNIIYRAEDSVLKEWLKPSYSIDGWCFDVADVSARNNAVQFAFRVLFMMLCSCICIYGKACNAELFRAGGERCRCKKGFMCM